MAFAACIMVDYRIGSLAVVRDGDVVGLVTASDLLRLATDRDAQAEEAGEYYVGPTTAEHIMQRHVKIMQHHELVQQAADRMLTHRIHALPVMRGDQLCGIMTDTDIVGAIGGIDA